MFFKSNSLEGGVWRANEMQGRPTANGDLRLLDDETLIASGSLEYADKKRAAFLAKLDVRGKKIWAIDQTGWDLTSVYELAIDGQGAIYAVGGMRNTIGDLARERAVMVKVDAEGRMLWTRVLQAPDSEIEEYSGATQLALSLDEQQVWAVGVTMPRSERTKPRAWSLSAADGAALSLVDLEDHELFRQGSVAGLAELLVRPDGLYYAWNAQRRVGEDTLGWESWVVRMNERGEGTWKVHYSANAQPGAAPHVRVRGLQSAAAGGLYVVGEGFKAPAPDAAPAGEQYGYVARFCPPP